MVSEGDKEGGWELNRNARRRVCVCVSQWGNMKEAEEEKDLVDVLCE